MSLLIKIKDLARKFTPETIQIRRHIHANPELSFEEFETSKYIQSKLEEFGIPYKNGFVKTGIVAHIEGINPHSKTIALRADIDALPILEENKSEYTSLNKGVMHACGHDVHSASLLGVAKILNEVKNQFEGTVKLIFQPAEEKLPGGASLMIKEGALKNPDATQIIGQHVYPELNAGEVGFRKGKYMASTDEIYLKVKGKGGHAALPQKCTDTILLSAQILVNLQQIVSRNATPDIPSVLSFGKINSKGGATNIIPDEVFIEGTFRTFDEKWRSEAHLKIKEIAEGIAKAHGGECVVDIHKGYPFLVNDETLTESCKNAAIAYLGEEKVVDLDLRMTAEDFAYYSQMMPACFYRLGVKNPFKPQSGLHTPSFDIDESAIETSIGLMSWMAIEELNRK